MKEDLVQNREPMPVYLFTGFVEAGKTTFLQKTLEDRRFQTGERTLMILCEEGETALEPGKFKVKPVEVRTVPSEKEFTRELLAKWEAETKGDRVMVEWNGMWLLDTLYAVMPEHWMVYQEFMFADARTFLLYNANMRQLVYDKLKSCELVVSYTSKYFDVRAATSFSAKHFAQIASVFKRSALDESDISPLTTPYR